MTTADERTDFAGGLAGQRVLVTAGAAGIGRAIVQRLAVHGAKLFICDISEQALAEFRVEYPQVGAVRTDVSDESQVDDLFDALADHLGGLDALINNAGIAGPTGAIEDIVPDEWRRCIDVCLTGQFLCARRAVPMLKAAGGGSIVNMSSASGKFGYAFRTPYSSAKFASIGLMESLAKELGPHNIRVNALRPGIVEGPRMDGVIRDRAGQVGVSIDEMKDEYLAKISLRRMVSPHDVAAMVAFLLSDVGANISGQSIGVDANVETL